MNQPIKPFCIDYEEARVEIFNAVSEASKVHNIPFYLLENIIESLLVQVREGKRNELEVSRRTYEQQLKEYKDSITEQND